MKILFILGIILLLIGTGIIQYINNMLEEGIMIPATIVDLKIEEAHKRGEDGYYIRYTYSYELDNENYRITYPFGEFMRRKPNPKIYINKTIPIICNKNNNHRFILADDDSPFFIGNTVTTIGGLMVAGVLIFQIYQYFTK